MVERLLCRLDRPRMRPGDVVTVLVRELDAQRFLVGDQRRQDDGNLRLAASISATELNLANSVS